MPFDGGTLDPPEKVLLQVTLAHPPNRIAIVGKNVEIPTAFFFSRQNPNRQGVSTSQFQGRQLDVVVFPVEPQGHPLLAETVGPRLGSMNHPVVLMIQLFRCIPIEWIKSNQTKIEAMAFHFVKIRYLRDRHGPVPNDQIIDRPVKGFAVFQRLGGWQVGSDHRENVVVRRDVGRSVQLTVLVKAVRRAVPDQNQVRPRVTLDGGTFDPPEKVLLQVAFAHPPNRFAVVGQDVEVATSLCFMRKNPNRQGVRASQCQGRQLDVIVLPVEEECHALFTEPVRPWQGSVDHPMKVVAGLIAGIPVEQINGNQIVCRLRRLRIATTPGQSGNVFLPIRDPVLIVVPVKIDHNIHPTQIPVDDYQIVGMGRTVPVSMMGIRFAHFGLGIKQAVPVAIAKSLQVVSRPLGQVERIGPRTIGQDNLANKMTLVVEHPNDHRTGNRSLVMNRTGNRGVAFHDCVLQMHVEVIA